jgi:hypothetical protein
MIEVVSVWFSTPMPVWEVANSWSFCSQPMIASCQLAVPFPELFKLSEEKPWLSIVFPRNFHFPKAENEDDDGVDIWMG